MGQLFEEYLSLPNGDWMQSSLVVNRDRTLGNRRRGRYRMINFADLKTKFNVSVAKSIRDEKKEQQKNRAEGDTIVYWMEHPDMVNLDTKAKEDSVDQRDCTCLQDHEQIRIWDAMEWEESEEDSLHIGIQASGALHSSQARDVLRLACVHPFISF